MTNSDVISFDGHINAIFTQVDSDQYEVMLNINSNQFLIMMKDGLSKMEEFELIATKGFMDVTKRSLMTLKKLVRQMYFMR